MKKKVKLYLHHSYYEPVTLNKRAGVLGIITQIFESVVNAIIWCCYAVGIIIISIISLPITIIKFLINFPALLKKAVERLTIKQFQKRLAIFAVIALIVAVSVQGLLLVATGQNLKGRVLGESDAALSFLQDAKTSLEAQNTEAAQANFSKALEQFKKSEQTLNSTSTVLQSLLAVVPQKQDADKLLQAAQKITEAGLKGTELLKQTEEMKLSAVGLNAGQNNRDALLQTQNLLNTTVQLANEASVLIGQVSISSIPEDQRPAFIAAKDTATFFQTNVTSLKEVCSLIFELLLGQKNVLIVFQNNNEIRASGGFMGTIGNAKLSNGSLGTLDIRTVYDWDGQLEEKIIPPQPLKAVTDRMFMRDSNWFASFPESANRISSYFEKEGGETPDLIIAMTPDVILDMLERTGPITLPQHNVTLNKENFIEQTQVATSLNYDKKLNQPKQFLADFFPLLMEKLGAGENGMMAFLEIFQQNLYHKHIVLYSRNTNIQNKILDFNWGGELRTTDRDYLSIINTNLGGTKTDRAMERVINLKSEVDEHGTVTNTISYEVTNPLPSGSGLNNNSFVRFYVPQDSIFITSSGFDEVQLPRRSTPGFIIDEKIFAWQKQVTQSTSTGTYIGKEAGKTWFGNWLNVEGGQKKTVTLSYTLPFKLDSLDRHSLLLQKQPGSLTDSLNYELRFAGRENLWNSANIPTENDNLKWNGIVTADLFLGTVLKK